MSWTKIDVLANKGNSLMLRLNTDLTSEKRSHEVPGLYKIRNSVCITFRVADNHNSCTIFGKFFNMRDTDGKHMLQISSKALDLTDKIYFTDSSEQYLGTMVSGDHLYTPVIEIKMDLAPKANLFESLYDDTNLIDFELRAKDGAVHFHRVVLAAWSPVLKSMFSNKWKETQEGHIEVESTTKVTLQQFKDYMYLQVLPETGLEQLLQLACYYMVSDLKQRCIHRLLSSFNMHDLWELIEFVVENERHL